jgi:PAS domain S-box-containing protein
MIAPSVTSEERYRLIIETAHDAFVAIDEHGRITDWNAQAEKSFGWMREEAVGRRLAETIIPRRDREAHESGLRRFRQTGDGRLIGRRIEISALHRDGHEFPVEMTITAVQGEAGWAFHAFLHDITEPKRAQEELRREKEILQAIFDRVPVMLSSWTPRADSSESTTNGRAYWAGGSRTWRAATSGPSSTRTRRRGAGPRPSETTPTGIGTTSRSERATAA